MSPDEAAGLVAAARSGDATAWARLVDGYGNLVWSVARAHRLDGADASDVSQTTWLRLVENLGRLQEPERVGAWLATTARRECLRVLRGGKRELLSALDDVDVADQAPDLDAQLLRDERARALHRALAEATASCQQLLRLLTSDPPPSYAEVSAALDIPIGSIGPTRARCLKTVRDRLTAAGITAGAS